MRRKSERKIYWTVQLVIFQVKSNLFEIRSKKNIINIQLEFIEQNKLANLDDLQTLTIVRIIKGDKRPVGFMNLT